MINRSKSRSPGRRMSSTALSAPSMPWPRPARIADARSSAMGSRHKGCCIVAPIVRPKKAWRASRIGRKIGVSRGTQGNLGSDETGLNLLTIHREQVLWKTNRQSSRCWTRFKRSCQKSIGCTVKARSAIRIVSGSRRLMWNWISAGTSCASVAPCAKPGVTRTRRRSGRRTSSRNTSNSDSQCGKIQTLINDAWLCAKQSRRAALLPAVPPNHDGSLLKGRRSNGLCAPWSPGTGTHRLLRLSGVQAITAGVSLSRSLCSISGVFFSYGAPIFIT